MYYDLIFYKIVVLKKILCNINCFIPLVFSLKRYSCDTVATSCITFIIIVTLFHINQAILTYRYTQTDFNTDKWHHCNGLENCF